MKKFKAGDHLVVNIDPLGLTEHHGLCVGADQVIHQRKDGVIEQISIAMFAEGGHIRRKAIAYDRETAIARAQSLLGYQPYHLLNSNCEHFVNWCIDETDRSEQVSNSLHLSAQLSARAGLLGRAASKVATGTAANVALVSTAAKMTGEHLGLPDSINTVIGTPGDLIAKPLETLIKGTGDTLSTSAEHVSDGEYGKAATSLVTGAAKTTVKATVVTPAKVIGDGMIAAAEVGKDLWYWLRH
ncbi:lecithin retinol acyltransferase family protein [Shewanella sp. Isolate11]|uniref:lecithin retinol acyltransferase family protein n=1 Tax=Shewanella sp. Isolate11 TaxID=2908530 RepID=UPI001EFC5E26|nr:lecithin retinol acyltransferase family protein [Shewanella sp. Isolate11]MCG9698025.1 lecithin retinol acyltransferase family protein [Shewanella sp. Isolate11]